MSGCELQQQYICDILGALFYAWGDEADEVPRFTVLINTHLSLDSPKYCVMCKLLHYPLDEPCRDSCQARAHQVAEAPIDQGTSELRCVVVGCPAIKPDKEINTLLGSLFKTGHISIKGAYR